MSVMRYYFTAFVIGMMVFVSGCGEESSKHQEAFEKIKEGTKEAKKKIESKEMKPLEKVELTAKTAFAQQKVLMPIILKEMKLVVPCLAEADSIKEAQKCFVPLDAIERKMHEINGETLPDDGDDEIVSWSAQDKNEAITEIKKAITELEPMVACMKKIDENAKDAMKQFIECSKVYVGQ